MTITFSKLCESTEKLHVFFAHFRTECEQREPQRKCICLGPSLKVCRNGKATCFNGRKQGISLAMQFVFENFKANAIEALGLGAGSALLHWDVSKSLLPMYVLEKNLMEFFL